MEIFLASQNTHKQQELSAIFSGHTIVLPSAVGIVFDPEETGNSFSENCLIKARTLFDLVKQPVIADDSGLCVDILSGAPGIYAARYAGKDFPRGKPGPKLSQETQNRLLIEEVNGHILSAADNTALSAGTDIRACRFVCALALYFGEDRFFLVQETMEGTLVEDISLARGKGGFGYDPVVIVRGTGKTAAELSPDKKNALSHRGKAARALAELSGFSVQGSGYAQNTKKT
jgi:XTP/dITP diphosphohydrolase